MSRLDQAYHITRDDADLYVEQVGPEDAPVLFYLHGGPGYSAFSFRDLVGDDLEDYRVIYADQRGAGRSYAGAPFDLALLADDVRAVLDALGLERANLLAHGFGAQIAVAAATAVPERIERLVLVNPWLSMPLLARCLQRHAARLAERDGEALPPEGALAEPDALDPEALVDQAFAWVPAKQLFDALLFPNPASRLRLEHSDATALFGPQEIASPRTPWRLDSLPALAALRRPTVVLAGRADRSAMPEQAEAALERLPHALFSLVDGGHYPWIDDPDAFLELLAEAMALPPAPEARPADGG